MDLTLTLINIAYLLMLVAFILREVLYLRLTLIAAHVVFIIYAFFTDNYSILSWNIIFFTINVYHAIVIFRKRQPVELEDENEKIYSRDFKCMSRREFLYLWQTGKRETVTDINILKKGEKKSDLFYIIKGKVVLKEKDEIFTELGPGDFIAEANIFSKSLVGINVIADGEVEYKVFRGETLENLRKLNPSVLSKLEKLVSRYMTAKLKTALRKDR